MSTRIYVNVTVLFEPSGRMIPKIIHWDNGREFIIESVRRIQTSASLKNGGDGDRYTVRINGIETFLYFQHATLSNNLTVGQWYVIPRL